MGTNDGCKYSVIVPVYNSEKYLNRCVDSILHQTISDLELILVNDGSKDSSGKICDEYKKKDSRVVVVHQENGGVSKARNVGLDIAKGEYIVFVDSDDYVDDTYLEHLDNDDADLVIASFTYGKSGKEKECIHERKCYYLSDKSIMCELLGNGKLAYMWGRKFKADIIKENSIRLIEGLNFGEDTCFVCEYLFCCKDLLYISEFDYNYVCGEEVSLCRNRGFDKKFIESCDDFNDKLQEIFYKNCDVKENVDKVININRSYVYSNFLFELIHGDTKYSSIKWLYKREGMIYALKNADKVFERENEKFRKILKTRSPILLWLYIKFSKLKNR